jgi:hypothetical protein
MFSLTQILLFILIFLTIGIAVFFFPYAFKLREDGKAKLKKYFIIMLFAVITSVQVLAIFYLAVFIKNSGFYGFMLTAVIFIMLALSAVNLSMRLNLIHKLKKLKIKNVKI